MAGKVILGRYGLSTDAGWTQIIPYSVGTAADSKFYYVNPTHGSASDSNAGTDPAEPLETIGGAAGKIGAYAFGANKRADWILLAEGETFDCPGASNNSMGLGQKGGYSDHAPFVFTSYNPNLVGITATTPRGTERAAPPLINVPSTSGASNGPIAVTAANTWGPAAFIGIDFHANNADPINAPGTYDNTKGSSVISFSALGLHRLILEDVHCKGGVAVQIDSAGFPRSNVIRRCSFQFFTAIGVTSAGMWNCLLEENFGRHNGWCGTAPTGNSDQTVRAGSNHNFYFNTTQTGDNLQKRYIFRGNFSYEGADVGLRCRNGGEVYDNLCVLDGWGIETGLANQTATLDPRMAINYSIHDNVCLDFTGSGIVLASANTSGPHGAHIYRNLIARTATGLSGPSDNEHTLDSDNVIVTCSVATLGGSPAITGSPITSTAGMPDSAYNLTDYATDHLGLADLATFLTNCSAQRRYNWDERYHAPYINNIIRPMYSMATQDLRPAYVHAGATALRARW
jgi:hypothetical protein